MERDLEYFGKLSYKHDGNQNFPTVILKEYLDGTDRGNCELHPVVADASVLDKDGRVVMEFMDKSDHLSLGNKVAKFLGATGFIPDGHAQPWLNAR